MYITFLYLCLDWLDYFYKMVEITCYKKYVTPHISLGEIRFKNSK